MTGHYVLESFTGGPDINLHNSPRLQGVERVERSTPNYEGMITWLPAHALRETRIKPCCGCEDVTMHTTKSLTGGSNNLATQFQCSCTHKIIP